MIKLTHHEMPVNKTLHHRTIEILTVLTLLIGSPSFLNLLLLFPRHK